MAERFFISEEKQLYVDLDMVTLCQRWSMGDWTVKLGDGSILIDDAAGTALFAALVAWRAAHPEPRLQVQEGNGLHAISRSEALVLSRHILEQAEQERAEVVDDVGEDDDQFFESGHLAEKG